MQGLVAIVIVLVGILGLSIGVWASTRRPSWLQIGNACLWGISGTGATIILLLTADLVRDQVSTIVVLVVLSFIVFFIGRRLNLV